jgi:hypothetical protein
MGRAFLVSLCIVASGCVTSHVQRLAPHLRPEQASDSIIVFEEAPEQSYTVIALIESQTGNVFESFDDLRANIVDQAAQLGGEAVIVGPGSREKEFIILMTGMIPSENKKLSAEVIVFQ